MRFVAGFVFGVAVGGFLVPVVVLVVATLVGLGLGTLWARRRARRQIPEPFPSGKDEWAWAADSDEMEDPAVRLEALGRVDLVVYNYTAEGEYRLFLRVPADTLDSLAVLAPELLVVVAEGGLPVIPRTRPDVGVVVLPPYVELHIALERREA